MRIIWKQILMKIENVKMNSGQFEPNSTNRYQIVNITWGLLICILSKYRSRKKKKSYMCEMD